VSDWRDDDHDEEPRWAREPTGEGVRILGSEAGGPRSTDSFEDDEYDTWSAAGEDPASRSSTGETSGSLPLPHWTEPPTGEVPRILDDDTSDDLESWSALTGQAPRFRTDAGDWAAGDFEEGELDHDDSTRPTPTAGSRSSVARPVGRRARRSRQRHGAAAGVVGGRRRHGTTSPTTAMSTATRTRRKRVRSRVRRRG
jgi:phosphatidate cytidylyltransferase